MQSPRRKLAVADEVAHVGRVEYVTLPMSTAVPTHSKVWLKRGREKSLLRKHPWIFSGEIETFHRHIANGTKPLTDLADSLRNLALVADHRVQRDAGACSRLPPISRNSDR